MGILDKMKKYKDAASELAGLPKKAADTAAGISNTGKALEAMTKKQNAAEAARKAAKKANPSGTKFYY